MSKRAGIPPKAYQFKKGQSGNLKGRPPGKGKARVSAFDVIAMSELTIRTGDTSTTVSAEEALHLKTYQQAIGGDKKAWAEVLDMIIVRERALDDLAPPAPGSRLLIDHHKDPDNAFEAMVLLGIAAYDMELGKSGAELTPYLLLEPWAVQMALHRKSLIRN